MRALQRRGVMRMPHIVRCTAAVLPQTTRHISSTLRGGGDGGGGVDEGEWRQLHAELHAYAAQQTQTHAHADVVIDNDDVDASEARRRSCVLDEGFDVYGDVDDDDDADSGTTLQRDAEVVLPPLWLPSSHATTTTAAAANNNADSDVGSTLQHKPRPLTTTTTANVLPSHDWFRMAGIDSYIAQQDMQYLSWPTPPAARVCDPQCLAHLPAARTVVYKHNDANDTSRSSSNNNNNSTTASCSSPRVTVCPGRRCCVLVVYAANDLRVHDNYALALAAARAEALGGVPVVALCVLDIRTFAQPSAIAGFYRQGPLRAQFLLDTVAALRSTLEDTLRVPLLVRCGRPEEHVPRLAVELGATDVFLTTQYAPEERRVHDETVSRLQRGVWVSRQLAHAQLCDGSTGSSGGCAEDEAAGAAGPAAAAVRVCECSSYAGGATTVRVREHRTRVCGHPYNDNSNNSNNSGAKATVPLAQVHSVWQTTLVHLDDLPTPVAAMREGERWYHDDVTAATIRPTAPYDASIARLARLPCWHELLPPSSSFVSAYTAGAEQAPLHAVSNSNDSGNAVMRGAVPTLQQLGYGDVARHFAFTEVIATTQSHPVAGETAALRHVDDWLERGGLASMLRLGRERRSPAQLFSNKLSRVSPYLAVGALSPRRLYEQLRHHTYTAQRDGFAHWQCREALLRLSRRDYWHWLAGLRFGVRLRYPYGPHPEASDAIADWRHDRAVVDRWCRGLTGIPFADAAMRELVGTGFVAEPGRQALVWLLARGYGQDWRIAAEWLARCSLDYDACVCYGNTAYCCELLPDDFGEPVRDVHYVAHKHDQTGIYVKRWLPQLSRVPPVYVHRPHVLTPRMQAMFAVKLGRNYPYPIKLWQGAQHTLSAAQLTSYVTACTHDSDNDNDGGNNKKSDTSDTTRTRASRVTDEHAIAGPGYGEAARHGTALLDPQEWVAHAPDVYTAVACSTSTRHDDDNSSSSTSVAVRHDEATVPRALTATRTWTDVYLPASAFDAADADEHDSADGGRVPVVAMTAASAARTTRLHGRASLYGAMLSCDAPTPIPQRLQHRQRRSAHARVAAAAVAAYRDEQQQQQQQQQQQATTALVASSDGNNATSNNTAHVTARGDGSSNSGGVVAAVTTATSVYEHERAARAAAAATVMLTAVPPHTSPAAVRRVCAWLQAACDGDVDELHRLLTENNNNNKSSSSSSTDGEAAAVVADLLNVRGQPHPQVYGGVQFDKRWTYTAPALVYAASLGRERAVRALLQWGAQPHTRSSTGLCARDYAEQRGYASIVALLRDAETAGHA